MPNLPEPIYRGVSIVLHRTDGGFEVRTFAEPQEVRLDRSLEVSTGRLDVTLHLTDVTSESSWEMPATKRNGEG